MKREILSIFDSDSYQASINHRNLHKCGSYPFNHGKFLNAICSIDENISILEIGTGIGYSSLCMAKNNSVSITTLDLSIEHRSIAHDLWTTRDVAESIEMIVCDSQEFFKSNSKQFDLLFVDGFHPNPDEIDEYFKVLGKNGTLISANHGWNKTTPEFIARIEAKGINYELLGETLLSSNNIDKIKKGVDLWNSKIDTY